MSFGIVRVQKIRAGSVKGIQIHDQREKGYSHTNPDIDFSRSEENYNVHKLRNSNFTQDVKKRIDGLDLKRAVRKDAVVMVQVLVASDKEFFDGMTLDKKEQFFHDSYDFLKKRYGEENIVSAIVHFDERTPHMHFNFVPVTEDGRLSAKSILTRQSLIDQQDKFFEEVGKNYNLERGIKGGKKKHLEVAEYKAHSIIQEASNKAHVMAQEASKMILKAEAMKKDLPSLKLEYETLRAYIDESDKISDVSVMYPQYVERSTRGLFKKETYVTVPASKWEAKHVSANQISVSKKAEAVMEERMQALKNSEPYQKIKKLKVEIDQVREENRDLNNRLKKANSEIERVNKIFTKYPDISDQFLCAEREIKKTLKINRGLELEL